jgi:hypothetical protein
MRLMKLAGFLTAIFGWQLCWSNPIYYEVENLGGDVWQYSYTAGNETGAAIDWFTIFFDFDLYAFDLVAGPFGDEVDPNAVGGPADWEVFVAPPEPLFPGPADDQPGFFDAFALGPFIEPDDLLSGFTVVFTWLGEGTPGVQPHTLYGDDLQPLLGDNLLTRPLLAGDVPEPGTLLLFVAGLLGLTAVRRRRTSICGLLAVVWAAA